MNPSLSNWVPRLIAAWRALRRAPAGPPEALLPEERRDVLAGVERLTAGLTGERALAGARYFEEPQLLGAYLFLYWPVSYAQGRSVLGELGAPVGDVLDLGSGPGPLAFAALDAGGSSALAVDRAPAALSVARALSSASGHALATAPWEPRSTGELPEGSWDTIVAGHVWNELFGGDLDERAQLAEAALLRLRPGGRLVLIEPALRETSRALLQVRDRLVARGAVVRAPCLYRGACPALAREGDWCHAERAAGPPPLVEELARAARLHRDTLKLTYLVLEPPHRAWPALPPGTLYRIVSEPLDQKGQHRRIGCGPDGRAPLVLPHKHVSEASAAFATLERGDLVRITVEGGGLEPRGDGLRLPRGARVERLARAGEPLPARSS